MIWYFDLGDRGTAVAWRAIRTVGLAVEARGVVSPHHPPRVRAALRTALAAFAWVRREHADRADAFLTALVSAAEDGQDLGDAGVLCDLAALAGLPRLVDDGPAEAEVDAATAAWQASSFPELPCLVRSDGRALVGQAPASTVQRFAT